MSCHFLLRGLFPPQDQTLVLAPPTLTGEFLTTSAAWEARKRGMLKFSSEDLRLCRGFATSLVAHVVRNLHPMQETQVRSLGREDLLEVERATHSSVLA